jgi:hypothetical protein
MSIFNIEKTESEVKNDEVRRCASFRWGALDTHKSYFEKSFDDFWNNAIVTPQEHCDALGNQAIQFFQIAALTIEYINTIDPSWIPPTVPYNFTINQDGTVTIGNKIV